MPNNITNLRSQSTAQSHPAAPAAKAAPRQFDPNTSDFCCSSALSNHAPSSPFKQYTAGYISLVALVSSFRQQNRETLSAEFEVSVVQSRFKSSCEIIHDGICYTIDGDLTPRSCISPESTTSLAWTIDASTDSITSVSLLNNDGSPCYTLALSRSSGTKTTLDLTEHNSSIVISGVTVNIGDLVNGKTPEEFNPIINKLEKGKGYEAAEALISIKENLSETQRLILAKAIMTQVIGVKDEYSIDAFYLIKELLEPEDQVKFGQQLIRLSIDLVSKNVSKAPAAIEIVNSYSATLEVLLTYFESIIYNLLDYENRPHDQFRSDYLITQEIFDLIKIHITNDSTEGRLRKPTPKELGKFVKSVLNKLMMSAGVTCSPFKVKMILKAFGGLLTDESFDAAPDALTISTIDDTDLTPEFGVLPVSNQSLLTIINKLSGNNAKLYYMQKVFEYLAKLDGTKLKPLMPALSQFLNDNSLYHSDPVIAGFMANKLKKGTPSKS